MLVVTNEAVVRRQVRKARLFLLAALVVFAVGFVTAWLPLPNEVAIAIQAGGLLLGILLWQISQYFARRWGPRYRQDAVLARALKGLDNRYTLVSFADARLPDYLLLGP